jgi:CRISPR-associated protein Csd1
MEQLSQWSMSPYTHPKVNAIYQYLSKNCLIEDLIYSGVVKVDQENFFLSDKISGQPYEKVMVRFRVLDADALASSKTWADQTLIEAYIRFYLTNQKGRRDICYLSGVEAVISENHPKGIVAANYGAKLVSANDSQGYTFRGRFQNAEQAFALSYEASQKVHSALTWLVKKQGVFVGNQDKRTFVCWNPEGKKTPNVLDAFGFEDDGEVAAEDFVYKRKLQKTFQGYQDQFEPGERIVIMSLDAATTGRLSITYYSEQSSSEFLDNICFWGETCRWYSLKFTSQKKAYYEVETPKFRTMVNCAFGTEKGGFIEANDKVLKEQTQRLVKCMIEKQNFPGDIMNALTMRASTPMAYSGTNRERVLSVACAAIVKYYSDWKKGEDYKMKLDVENQDRSYLFGRLLAIYEQIERRTYENGENREPNAIRLQAAYVNHPMQTRMVLEEAVNPYLQKHKPLFRERYRRLISEITLLFKEEDYNKMNLRLGETYLLGYYLQRADLYKSKEKEEHGNE